MSTSKFIIRVQSPQGTKRIEATNDETLQSLYEKVYKEFSINSNDWKLFLDINKRKQIPINNKNQVKNMLRHGDMIYLLFDSESGASTYATSSTITSQESGNQSVVEDEIDQYLSRLDGKIIRPRDEQLCHHGKHSQCINCAPLEPFDNQYLSSLDPPIKFLSFHSYIKKLQSGVDKGKYLGLENLNCKIKPGCKEHPPWPRGICNKCQPNTVYLNRQPYRHVDNLLFENPQIVDRFLNYWRSTGHQRIGLLYGRYEHHDVVPLGIRATVAAIYEPPQESDASFVQLLPDPIEGKVEFVAKKLGLKCVGWIFTDLVTDDTRKGTVKNFRGNTDSHFLSAEECIMAAHFQNKYKNPCKLSSDGYFGSKFVTVVVTGDSNNQIHFEGYQVSNQCMALVRDNCMVPTYDASELAYIKESTNEQFVPDVYYREKDNYNNEVTKPARPLPVEYLLVDLTVAFPKDAYYTFNEDLPFVKKFFPIENRMALNNEMQDFRSLSSYMEQFKKYRFMEAMNDFHLLVFLASNHTVSFENTIERLLVAIANKDAVEAAKWCETDEWKTAEYFMHNDTHAEMDTHSAWSCKRCTFMNPSNANQCQMCSNAK